MLLPEKIDTKPILKKHVNTIHCSNNLTLIQRKLFNALLFNAYYDLPEKSQYQISVKKLCELIGYNSRDYKKLRKSILDLITTAIEWNVIDQENGEQKDKWRASAIISSAKIEYGVCTYEFSSLMRELFYAPEVYGKIDIKLMVEFNSSYGLALYENCIRFQGIPQTQWLSISVFRKLMGIPDSYYQNFCDLKKRVLDVAVKEVNEYSPIDITPEIRRMNKKATCIRFKLSNKNTTIVSGHGVQFDQINIELVNVLKNEFCLSTEIIMDINLKYGADYVQNKIHLIKKSESYKLGKIRDLAAYLIDALKRDYQSCKSSSTLIAEKRSILEDRSVQERKNEEEKIRLANEKKRKIVDDYLNKMTDHEFNSVMANFEEYLHEKDSFYLFKKYKEIGMQSAAVRAMFNSFVHTLIERKSDS